MTVAINQIDLYIFYYNYHIDVYNLVARVLSSTVRLASWIEPKQADCGLGYDAAAAETAGVADPAEIGDSWVVRRADAKFYWRFLESFFLSKELMSEAPSCTLRIYINCALGWR